MALTVEWTGLLQGVTFGQGTGGVWFNANQPVTGIGVPTPKDQDVDLKSGDGEYAGTDRKASRLVVASLIVVGTSASDTMDKFEALTVAFIDSAASDVTYELYLPGKHFSVSGRPRGIIEDLSRLKSHRIDCVGTFKAHQPTMTAL